MQAPFFIKGKLVTGYGSPQNAILLNVSWASVGVPAYGLFLVGNKLVQQTLASFESDGHVA